MIVNSIYKQNSLQIAYISGSQGKNLGGPPFYKLKLSRPTNKKLIALL